MKEWENFLAARKQYLNSIGTMRRLSPEIQAQTLEAGLNANQLMDVMNYLLFVENPTATSKLPVASLMIESLGDMASFPGEYVGKARSYIEVLAKDEKLRATILDMADRKISRCIADPDDDEIWLYTAAMLQAIDENKFHEFMIVCRNHDSEKIRKVAEFFEE